MWNASLQGGSMPAFQIERGNINGRGFAPLPGGEAGGKPAAGEHRGVYRGSPDVICGNVRLMPGEGPRIR